MPWPLRTGTAYDSGRELDVGAGVFDLSVIITETLFGMYAVIRESLCSTMNAVHGGSEWWIFVPPCFSLSGYMQQSCGIFLSCTSTSTAIYAIPS